MKYNALFDVAFTVITEYEDPYDSPAAVLLQGLRKRLEYLEQHPADCGDSFGFSDSYAIEEDKT